MHHLGHSNPPPAKTPCWYCQYWDGISMPGGVNGLCSREGCPRVRSQPENGYCHWTRIPGVDDEAWKPAFPEPRLSA